MGFRKAETQTLVSSRATSGTAFRLDLSACLTDFGLDIALRDCSGSCSHFAQKTLKVGSPLRFWEQSKRDAGIFSQSKRFKRSKDAFFKDCLKSLCFRNFLFRQRHMTNYNDDPTLGSMAMEAAINLKTAKALNLTIPQSVLFRADKVIK